jgi:hypothetical protein
MIAAVLNSPFQFATAPPPGGDPNWADVSALLPMQGANNGTTFTDVSNNALTVTALGNAKTTTADFKWGNSCAIFDGSGDYLTIAASSVMDFGTGNYTLEMWVNWTSVSGTQTLLDIGNGTTQLYITGGNTVYFFDSGAFVINAVSMTQLNAGTWYYLAVVRSGNTRTIYVNGVSVASASRSGSAGSSAVTTKVGVRFDTALGYNGKMQDLRITKGVARDVTTIPTAAFPTS